MPAIASIFLGFEAIRYEKDTSKKKVLKITNLKDEFERARGLTRSSKQRNLRGWMNLKV